MSPISTRFGRTALCAAGMLACLSVSAAPPDRRVADLLTPAADAEQDAPLDISGDNLTADQKTGWYRASGNVRIVYGAHELRADEVRVNAQTGEIVASGNVVLTRRNHSTWRGSHLVYNFMTGEGLSSALDVSAGPFRLLAEQSHRQADGTFVLRRNVITTCTNAPGHFHFGVTSRETEFQPGDHFTTRGSVLRLMGVPIFYVPYWYRDLAHHYGFRFVPGYSSSWGGFLLSAYKFRLLDLGEGREVTSKTHLDTRSERGLAYGQDFAWRFGEGGIGMVTGYLLDDQEPGERDVAPYDDLDSQRYRFKLLHDVNLTPRDQILLQANYLSDTDVLQDFFEDEYRLSNQPENYLTYGHTADSYAAGVGVYGRINTFYDAVNRLPEAWFEVMRQEVGPTDLYYESATRGGFLQREFADYEDPDNPPAESYDTLRLDSRHMFFLPEKLFGFLNVVPRAGVRATYYGDTWRDELIGSPPTTQTTTNAAGLTVVTTTPGLSVTNRVADGAGVRVLPEIGFELAFKAYGLYEDADGRWRHVVEPYANYTFVPEPNLVPSELPQFDEIDTLDLQHYVRLGTRHQIQRKGEKGVYTPVDADLYAIYAFDKPNDAETGLDLLGVDSKFRPANWLHIDLDGTYDVHASEVSTADGRVRLWNSPIWDAAGEINYRVNETTLFSSSLTYALSDAWSFNVYNRFDAESSRLEEQGAYIQFKTDCLAFRLRGRYLPGYTRSDGTERDDDYRVYFYTWLTAFAPESP